MNGKQITDLAIADSFNDGDLMLIRKSDTALDKKITYSSLLESIGSSAVSGYVSTLDENNANKIILKAANNASISNYYQGMRISFRVPAKTDGIVQVKIGDLDYKNLYQYQSDSKVSLEKDDYVEAILIDDAFYQTNDFESIVNTELESSDSFDEKDLILIRKHNMDVDTIITYSDFLESIGNSAIDGYLAEAGEKDSNKIILKAANNAPINKYHEGMRVSFIAPARTNGVVQLRIGGLEYKNLYRYQSNVSISLDQDDYIEAVLIDSNFYQINDLKTVANIYTNDYICTDHKIHKNDILTDLILETAHGLRKREYYNGMSITFMCPVDTKGVVRVNIDELGAKDVIEGDVEDFLYSPLYKGQIVQAVYNGVCFVKNKFKVEDPKIRQSLEPCPILSTEEKPQPITPIENMLEYNVGQGVFGDNTTYHFPTLRSALEEILSKYSDSSGRRVTLNILSELTTSKDSVVIKNRNLSWITIKGNAKNQVKILFEKESNHKDKSFFALNSCTNFNFAKDIVFNYGVQNLRDTHYFFHLVDCNFSMENVTLNFVNFQQGGFDPSTFYISGGNVIMDKVNSNGMYWNFYIHGKKSIVSLSNCKFTNGTSCDSHNVLFYSPNSEFTVTNCDLSSVNPTGNANIFVMDFATITQINSKAILTCYHMGQYNYVKPNTSNSYVNYTVTGSQDKVGTDN